MATSDRGLQASTTMYGLAQWQPENLYKRYTLAVDVLVYSGIIGQGFRAYHREVVCIARAVSWISCLWFASLVREKEEKNLC